MKHWWTFRPNFRPEKICCLPTSDPTKMPTRSRHPRPAVDVYEPWQLAGSMTEMAWGVQGVRVSVTGWAPRVALGFSAKKKHRCFLMIQWPIFFAVSWRKISASLVTHTRATAGASQMSYWLTATFFWIVDLWKPIKCYGSPYILKGWNWLLFSTVPFYKHAIHFRQTPRMSLLNIMNHILILHGFVQNKGPLYM